MKNSSHTLFFLLVIFSAEISCGQKKQEQQDAVKAKVSKECRSLNDSATKKINSFYTTNLNEQLDSAMFLLKKATECDTSYFLAYSNLTTVLALKGEYDSAIKVVNILLRLTKNDPEIVVYKGMLYEKQNKKESAQKEYNLANKLYDDRLAQYPDSLEIVGSKMFLKAYLEGKEKALSELDIYIKKYPNNELLQQYREMLTEFQKDDFIGSIGPLYN
ncbi:MAG: tetratricopeptide repeat protein [Bacteroidota bacterium]